MLHILIGVTRRQHYITSTQCHYCLNIFIVHILLREPENGITETMLLFLERLIDIYTAIKSRQWHRKQCLMQECLHLDMLYDED